MPERARTPGEVLEQYVAALRRRWPLAVAIVVVAGLAGLAVAAQRPKSYEATAKLLVGQQRQVDALLGTTDYSPDPERELNTSLQLITSEPVADRARTSLGLDDSAAALVARVAAGVDRNSNIVTISARDASPERAAAIANAFAAGYRDYRAEAARAALSDAIASARTRLRDLPEGNGRTALERELTRLETAEPLQTGGVQVVQEAAAAGATRHPRPAVSALLATFLGLIVAALAIAVLARTDRRVSGDAAIESLTGQPVLARVPRWPRAADDALASLALRLANRRSAEASAGILLVTSAGPDEGTPEVVLGLTRALGAIGRPAIAIEADLRTPTFDALLGAPGVGGLTAILAGAATLDDELISLGEGAVALPAGRPAELPQALLAGEGMKATIEEAWARADVVVLAAAPAGVVGDPVALAGLADEVLLVARDDVTRPGELQRALRALGDAGVPPAGVVVTARPGRRRFGRVGAAEPEETEAALPATASHATSEVTA